MRLSEGREERRDDRILLSTITKNLPLVASLIAGLVCLEEDGGPRDGVNLRNDFVKCLMVGDCITESKCSLKDKSNMAKSIHFLVREISVSKRIKNWSKYALEVDAALGCTPLTFFLSLACIVGGSVGGREVRQRAA